MLKVVQMLQSDRRGDHPPERPRLCEFVHPGRVVGYVRCDQRDDPATYDYQEGVDRKYE